MTKAKVTREIIIGLTGGIGVDFENVIGALEAEFRKICDSEFSVIKLSKLIQPYIETDLPKCGNEPKRIESYMNQASELRKKIKKNSLLAILAMSRIHKYRNDKEKNKKYAIYVLDSLKRPEEAELLRNVYGRNFFLIGIQTSKEKRISNIKQKTDLEFYHNDNDELKNKIENLITKDFNETNKKSKNNNPDLKKYGQNVVETFPTAHYFVDTENNLNKDVKRFVDILFGHPYHTPTIDERNMFTAKGIALRSADLSRQVGAVIANDDGDIIATGCNEVPKFGGGFYEPEDESDARDYIYNGDKDSNLEEKKEILADLIKQLLSIKFIKKYNKKLYNNDNKINKLYEKLDEAGAKSTDLLEFGRTVHAELAAICDAAQRGVKTKGTTLYCTTFPCHLCIKHILAVGIKRVVYIYPYPKSKTESYFEDSVTNNKSDARNDNKLLLAPFIGISPRRFLHVFRHDKRKKEDKINPKPAQRTNESPYLQSKSLINYYVREIIVLKNACKTLRRENIHKSNINSLSPSINKIYKQLKKIINNLDSLSKSYWDDVVK